MKNTNTTRPKNGQGNLSEKEPPSVHSPPFSPEILNVKSNFFNNSINLPPIMNNFNTYFTMFPRLIKSPGFLRWMIPLLCVGMLVLAPERGWGQTCPTTCGQTMVVLDGEDAQQTVNSNCQNSIGEDCAGFIISPTFQGGTITFDAGYNESCGGVGQGTGKGIYYDIVTPGPTTTCTVLQTDGTEVVGEVINVPLDAISVTVYICKNGGNVNVCNVSNLPSCELQVTCPPTALTPAIACGVDSEIAFPPATDEASFEALGGTISDNPEHCGTLNISSNDVFVGNSCDGGTITRTYTISDDNSSTMCTQTIAVNPAVPPAQPACPSLSAIDCSVAAAAMPGDYNNITSTAGTGACVVTKTGVPTSIDKSGITCGGGGTIMITYVVTDNCGRTYPNVVCPQTVNAAPIPAQPACPSLSAIDCSVAAAAMPGDYNNITSTLGTDPCDVTKTGVPTSIDKSGITCGGGGTIMITYVVTDNCGRTYPNVVCPQTVNAAPIPDQPACPSLSAIDCSVAAAAVPGDYNNITSTLGTDPCDVTKTGVPTSIDKSGITCGGGGTIMITYVVTDNCGRTYPNVVCPQTVNAAPIPAQPACPSLSAIDCSVAAAAMPGDYNNITSTIGSGVCIVTKTGVPTSIDKSGFTCSGGSISITFVVTDNCGNTYADVVCPQAVNPAVAPDPPTCPDYAAVTCAEAVLLTTADYEDLTTTAGSGVCERIITATAIDVNTDAVVCDGSGDVVITYEVTDECGGTYQNLVCNQDVSPAVAPDPPVCPDYDPVGCEEAVLLTTADYPDLITTAGSGVCERIITAAASDVDVSNVNGCGTGDVIVTYSVTDNCGGTYVNLVCPQDVLPAPPPVITSILPPCYKYCAEMINPQPSDITFEVECDLETYVDIMLVSGSGNCPGTVYTYKYVVKAVDCDLESEPEFRDFIINNDGPTITCPPFNLILQCGDDNNHDYINTHLGLVSATTSCDLGVTITNNFTGIDLTSCGQAKVVTFTATDACDRTATCTTTIAIQDNQKPHFTVIPPRVCDVIECGADADYWYNHWINYMLTGLEAEDNCSDPEITADEVPLNKVCDDYGKAVTVVTFRATDDCDNYTTITANFTIINEHPAKFNDVPADVTVGCGDPIEFGPAPTITEECQTTVMESDATDDSDPCAIKYTRTWTATDACGGLSTYVMQTTTELDNEDPYFTFVPDGFTSGCINSDGVITTYAQICSSSDDAEENAMNGEMDLLSSDLEMVIDDSQNKEVKVGLRFKDLYIPKGAIITKAWIQFTADATIDIDPSELTINGFAGDNAMTFSETDNNITNRPKTNAVVSWEPADWMVVGDNHEPQRTPDLSAIVQEIVNRDGYTDQSALGFVVCGTGKRTAVSYDLNPDQAPEIYVKYEVTGTFGIPEATDDCGDVMITHIDTHLSSVKGTLSGDQEVPPSGSAGTGTVSGTLDVNTGALKLDISFSGLSGNTTVSHIHSAPAGSNGGVSVNLGPLGFPVGVTSGSYTAETTLSAEQVANTMAGNMYVNVHTEAVPSGELRAQLTVSDCDGSITRTWTAKDVCGNTATASQTINFFDHVPPVFTFVPPHVNTFCDEFDFPPTFGTPEVYDNCGGVTITHVDYFDIGDENSCDEDDEDSDYRRMWTATDGCGNTTTAVQRFNVKESFSLFGFIATEENQMVENVEVTLDGFGSFGQVNQTLSDGMYYFNDLTMDQNYSATPSLDIDPRNGVSSFDMVLITKHVLQMDDLDSPYKIIAADVNRSGIVSTLDLLEIRKLILHVDETFQNNTSWRFIPSDFVFPISDNPFATTFSEMVAINGLTEGEQHDFVAIKIGDVTGNAETNGFTNADDRTFVDELVFNVTDQQLKAGETYEVSFRADNFEAIHGYQFSLNFDQTAMEFAGLNTGDLINLKDNNFGLALLDEGVITTSWTNQNAHSVEADAELFQISFIAKADVKLSEVIHLSSQFTKAEAYNDKLELMEVAFRFEEGDVLTNDFRLYQNTPNPFKQETLIGFELPEATKGTLNVYDVSGRLLKKVDGDFVKGYNSLSLTEDGLPKGLLYYQLVTPTHTATKKMMMQ